MATNRARADGRYFNLVVTAGKKSGDPVVVGNLYGVCQIDADPVTNTTTLDSKGIYNLLVNGITNAGAGSAVAVGDIVYLVAANTPPLSKDTTGVRFGYALDPVVASNSTTTIRVKLGY
jgi:predicted RecA/RadA family phage recombinase